MAVGSVNMKDVGGIDSITMGGMEGGATPERAEENRSEGRTCVCL